MADQQHIHWLFDGRDAWNTRRRENKFTPDFSGADLYDAFQVAHTLTSDGDIPLAGFNLSHANFAASRLNTPFTTGSADQRGADLGGADLRGADLRGASLRSANLRGAQLPNAKLGDADLIGARLPPHDRAPDGKSLLRTAPSLQQRNR